MEVDEKALKDVAAENPANEMDAVADMPIMMLFQRLIGNENKQNTVLTNSQIMEILEKEFQINTEEVHELEMDIYLSIMKKFLKDWPQWDDFDSAINELKQKNNQVETDKMLLKKYKQLKNYLLVMLDIAMPSAKEKVREVEEKFNKILEEQQPKESKEQEEDLSKVILEIQCTRPQLNNLILRHPHPKHNYSIFNTVEIGPSTISLNILDYETILNWWDIEICFKLQNIHFIRTTVHDIKHTLMNNKLHVKNKMIKFRNAYQEKSIVPGKNHSLIWNKIKKQQFADTLSKIFMRVSPEQKHLLQVLYSVIEKDLEGLPKEMVEMTSYRKHFSKNPYIRDLFTEVPEAKNDKEAMNYDLHLREMISPMYQIDIHKVDPMKLNFTLSDMQNVYVKCKSCSMKFMGYQMLEQLKQHILDHPHEPDWLCVKCKKCFTMAHLAKKRWVHKCKSNGTQMRQTDTLFSKPT